MDHLKHALMQKLQEIQELLMGGQQDVGMESELSESPIQEEVEEKSEKEMQEEDRAPVVKDKNPVDENIEEAKGRAPMSFKEKAKAYNKR